MIGTTRMASDRPVLANGHVHQTLGGSLTESAQTLFQVEQRLEAIAVQLGIHQAMPQPGCENKDACQPSIDTHAQSIKRLAESCDTWASKIQSSL